ncbi:retrovirus polyprotein, putative [Perkinsus marinus ATCC 50983]|uniref:Retrovirus polyprotein, putative n=1 Tax=Perkinsus marinus (strain ATCC 50983 / TXsc) TaxID=423536 RepID=C5KJW9_PERM5|nr:retrovirus polyprotein, putative [Perkinsus marinus ATCC 50983]EER15227.1 retrovirus polyprotein, putative [Perkinsus marinus ATCC 50983]|eukprot:XP_002783431.1 retrovirus polyprotein, putative [Perkinsus marinus ATCC 50983]
MFSRVLAEADTDTMGVYSTIAVLVSDNFDNSSLCSEEDDEALMNDSLPTDDGVAVLPVAGQRLEEDVPPELIGLVNSNRVRRVDPDWVYQDSKGRIRTYVPEGDRSQALGAAHGDGHASPERMLRAMMSTVWWPKMSPDIDAYCSVGCARHAARAAAASPRYDLFPVEARRFSSVAMDHLGPFNGLYVLVVVDKVTGWLEACVVDDKSAQSTALALYDVWVSRWGWFDSITHDNDAGFCSATVKSLFERHQVTRTLSPPYWPRGNGIAEAAVKEIKYVIRRSGEVITGAVQLKALVAAARLLHNSSAADGCGYCPYEIVTGKKLKTLLEVVYGDNDPGPADPEKIENMLNIIVEQKRRSRDRSRAAAISRAEKWRSGSYGNDLHEGDLVFVVQLRGYGGRVALGPFRIGNVDGSLVYLRGEEDPVSRGECVPYCPDPRYSDVAGEDHQAMKVEFNSLTPDMMIMFEVEELDGQVKSLDVGRVVSEPLRDKVKVEPYASPTHLFWFRRQPRERRLVTVSKSEVKFSTSGTFLEPDGKLSSESIELLSQRGYIQ